MFNLFLYDDIKQDFATTIAHSKYIIEFLKQHKIMSNALSTIWEDTDGRADQYICATALELMSMLSYDFYVIIGHGISSPGNGI